MSKRNSKILGHPFLPLIQQNAPNFSMNNPFLKNENISNNVEMYYDNRENIRNNFIYNRGLMHTKQPNGTFFKDFNDIIPKQNFQKNLHSLTTFQNDFNTNFSKQVTPSHTSYSDNLQYQPFVYTALTLENNSAQQNFQKFNQSNEFLMFSFKDPFLFNRESFSNSNNLHKTKVDLNFYEKNKNTNSHNFDKIQETFGSRGHFNNSINTTSDIQSNNKNRNKSPIEKLIMLETKHFPQNSHQPQQPLQVTNNQYNKKKVDFNIENNMNVLNNVTQKSPVAVLYSETSACSVKDVQNVITSSNNSHNQMENNCEDTINKSYHQLKSIKAQFADHNEASKQHQNEQALSNMQMVQAFNTNDKKNEAQKQPRSSVIQLNKLNK